MVLLRFSGELFAHSRPAISNWTGLWYPSVEWRRIGLVNPAMYLATAFSAWLAGLPGDRPDRFGLDGLEEGLDHCVVVAVALSTHRDQQAMFFQPRLIVD